MVQRMGMVIKVRPERIAEYRRLHAAPWPEMNAALKRARIANYSIFLHEQANLLFGYWEYEGTDYARDMKWLGEQEVTRRWLAHTDPCQEPFDVPENGAWWSGMEQVFFLP